MISEISMDINGNRGTSFLRSIDFEGKRVIEIGSGSGGFTCDYLTNTKQVVCIDKDNSAHRELEIYWKEQKFSAEIILINGEFQDIDLLDIGKFDFAVFSHSF